MKIHECGTQILKYRVWRNGGPTAGEIRKNSQLCNSKIRR